MRMASPAMMFYYDASLSALTTFGLRNGSNHEICNSVAVLQPIGGQKGPRICICS